MESWHFVLLTILLSILIYFGSQKVANWYGKKSSYKIVKLSIWLFFVMINAYFGGALTLFFTNEVSLHFENLRDVLKQVPTWTLLSLDGLDSLFQIPASQGPLL